MKMISITKADGSEFLIERLTDTQGLSKDGFLYAVLINHKIRMLTDDYHVARELVDKYE